MSTALYCSVVVKKSPASFFFSGSCKAKSEQTERWRRSIKKMRRIFRFDRLDCTQYSLYPKTRLFEAVIVG